MQTRKMVEYIYDFKPEQQIIKYWNAYQKKEVEWNTATGGTYMTVMDGDPDDKHDHDVLSMDETVAKGLARLAWYEAKRPDKKFALWFGPCAFSNRDVWIHVDERPGARVQITAKWRVSQMKGQNDDGTWTPNHKLSNWQLDENRRIYDVYKRTYKLSSQYF